MRNKKAQWKSLAMVFLLTSITLVSGAMMKTLSDGANNRAEYYLDGINAIYSLEEAKLFYSEMMKQATVIALEDKGFNLESDFCPLDAVDNQNVKDSIYAWGQESVETHKMYKDLSLPCLVGDDTTQVKELFISTETITVNNLPVMYLIVSGMPFEPMNVSQKGLLLTKQDKFLVRIKGTADLEPDVVIESMRFLDMDSNEIPNVVEGEDFYLSVVINNSGKCAPAKDVVLEITRPRNDDVTIEKTVQHPHGDLKKGEKTYGAIELMENFPLGTYTFTANAIVRGEPAELDSTLTDNVMTASIDVIEVVTPP